MAFDLVCNVCRIQVPQGGKCPRCGGSLDPIIQAGAKIGKHYIVDKVIGQGGMGYVVRARHNLTGQVVAIKTLSPHLAKDPGLRERFLQEAKALAELDHPNIMTLHYFLEEDGHLFLVMQYINGQDLEMLYHQSNGLSASICVPIFYRALKGLFYIHSRGIFHRDLKPANIMVASDGRVKLADFGIARMTRGPRLTVAGVQVGTVFYMAPELLQGGPADQRSDIYAMGICFFEVLTGHLPYTGDDYTVRKGHVESAVPDPSDFRSDIPLLLSQIIVKSLAKKPRDRFQNAEEFWRALERTGLTQSEPLLNQCVECRHFFARGETVVCPSRGAKTDCLAKTSSQGSHKQNRRPSDVPSLLQSHSFQDLPFGSQEHKKKEFLNAPVLEKEIGLSHQDIGYSQRKAPEVVLGVLQGAKPQDSKSSSLEFDRSEFRRSMSSSRQVPANSQGAMKGTEQGIGFALDKQRLLSVRRRRPEERQRSYKQVIQSHDGAEMVLVKAGSFYLGSMEHEENEKPMREMFLEGYYMDRYPVTNEQYKQFVQEAGYPAPSHWKSEKGYISLSPIEHRLPVVNVCYEDALAYCSWSGKRLPTEMEWEKAARSGDTRLFPWGKSWKERRANLGLSHVTSVDAFPKGQSSYGVFDMLGNVWEWVEDWYQEDLYRHLGKKFPKSPSSGLYRSVRGGSHSELPRSIRVTSRGYRPPHMPGTALGFRCVLSLSALDGSERRSS